jgi:hypothetical protein
MKKIDKKQLHTVYFKTENNVEDYNILKKINFIKFFDDFDIKIETYSIKFLINSKDEYFIKFEIIYQSLQSILENINSLCIFNDCNEMIEETDKIFCQSHLSSEMIKVTDIKTINNYFKIRNQKLEESYNNYSQQSDLENYLKKHPKNNNNDVFKVCNFELILVSVSESYDLLELKLNFEDASDFSDSSDIDFNVSINDIEELSINNSDSEDGSEDDSTNDSDDIDDDIDDDIENNMNIKELIKCFDTIMNINVQIDGNIDNLDDIDIDDIEAVDNVDDI